MIRPDWGVIVGRFQVNDLHDGHMELIRQVKARHSAVLIFVGTPGNKSLSQSNPLNFPVIRLMINAKFPDITVLEIKDCRTDEEWSQRLDEAIGNVIQGGTATLYGGRDSFVPHYKGHYKPVELTLPLGASIVGSSGTSIRYECSNRVLESAEFRAGMIYAAYHQWMETKPCVDVAIFTSDHSELCLVKKRGEDLWRFPGGHFEHRHKNWEGCAKEEAMEETGNDIQDLEYLWSGLVDDWRYAGVSDKKIATTFYRAVSMARAACPLDIREIQAVEWFKLEAVQESMLVPEHKPLWAVLEEKLLVAGKLAK